MTTQISVIQFLLSQVRTSTTALVGGKVYFYNPGTLSMTGVNIWLDAAGSSPASNPVTLDANATAQVYASGQYRVVIKDADGVTRFDRDDMTFYNYGSVYYPNPDCADQGIDVVGSAKSYLTAIGTDRNATLCFKHSADTDTTVYTVGTDLTIPSNVTVTVECGAILTVSSAKALTINGKFDAGLYKVFSHNNYDGVIFGLNSVKAAYPQWWGAKGDGATDDLIPLASAVRSVENGTTVTGSVSLPAGNYLTSDEIPVVLPITIEGENASSTIITTNSTTANLISVLIPVADADNKVKAFTLRDVGLYSSVTKVSGYALVLAGSTYWLHSPLAERVHFKGFLNSLHIKSAAGTQIDKCIFWQETSGGVSITVENDINGDAGDTRISGTWFIQKLTPDGGAKGVYQISGGGLHLLGNKFIGYSYPIDVVFNSANDSGQLYIESNGIDSTFTGTAAGIIVRRTTNFRVVVITNNYIFSDSGIVIGEASHNVTGGIIAGNYIHATTGVNLYNGSNWVLAGNNFDAPVAGTNTGISEGALSSSNTITDTNHYTSYVTYPVSTGSYARKRAIATGTPSGTTTYFDIAVAVPSGAKLLGAQLVVTTALTAGETWKADYNGGSSTAIATTGQAAAKNTKINKVHVDEITTNTTNIRITRDSGNFTNAVGVIQAIVYYEAVTTQSDY
jgi:hypothetical protein